MDLNNRIDRSIHAYYNDSEFQDSINRSYTNYKDIPKLESEFPMDSDLSILIANNYTYFTQTEELLKAKLPRLEDELNEIKLQSESIDSAHIISEFINSVYKTGLVPRLLENQINHSIKKQSDLTTEFNKRLPKDIESRLKENISNKNKQINFLESHYIQAVDTCLDLTNNTPQFGKSPLMAGETPSKIKKITANKVSLAPYKDIRLKYVPEERVKFNKQFNQTSGLLLNNKGKSLLFPRDLSDVYENRQLSFNEIEPKLDSKVSYYEKMMDELVKVNITQDKSETKDNLKLFVKPEAETPKVEHVESKQLDLFSTM